MRNDQKGAQSEDFPAPVLRGVSGFGESAWKPRNDLGRGLFDGISAREAGAMARERGLRLFLLQPDNRLLVVLMLGTQMVNAGGHSPCQLMTETMSLPGGAVVAAQWKRS